MAHIIETDGNSLRGIVHHNIRLHRRDLCLQRWQRAVIIAGVGMLCWLPVVAVYLFVSGRL